MTLTVTGAHFPTGSPVGLRAVDGHIETIGPDVHAQPGDDVLDGTDRLLVPGRRHLEAVLAEYADHYNGHRPHRSLDRRCPSLATETTAPITSPDPVCIRRTDGDAGLIHGYRLAI